MFAKQIRRTSGVTLVEVMAAVVVLAITALGALGYQYHAAKHVRIARAQMAATRTAQLLIEDWKSTGGSSDYNPAALGLGFSSALTLPSGEGAPLPTGVYSITVDDVPILVVLNWSDVAYDSVAEITLRQLSVTANWDRELDAGDIELGEIVSGRMAAMRSLVTLTTYVRLDAAGG